MLWDPVEDKWSDVEPMNKRRSGVTGSVLPDGRFAVVGGINISDESESSDDALDLHDWEIYDPLLDEWQQMGTFNSETHAWSSAAATEHELFVIGGNGCLDEIFDIDMQRWVTLPESL